jgi:hypothetical protein
MIDRCVYGYERLIRSSKLELPIRHSRDRLLFQKSQELVEELVKELVEQLITLESPYIPRVQGFN